jgi:hypothetical protein
MGAVLLSAQAEPSIESARGEVRRSWEGMKNENDGRDRDHGGSGDDGNTGRVSHRDTQ